MMTKISVLIALTTLAIGVQAQSQFSDLPACGATCAQNSASAASGCASSDTNCLCNSQPYVDAVYSCIAGACDYGEQSSTIGHLGQICAAAANNPAPAPSSTTSSSSSSAAAGVSTTSSSASSSPAGVSTTASGTGAPVSTTVAPVAFTHTPSEVAAALSASSSSATAAAATGTTTGAPRAATTQSQSTRVVVKTVGGEDEEDGASGTGASGNNILNGNGAMGVTIDVVFTGVVAFVGAFLAF